MAITEIDDPVEVAEQAGLHYVTDQDPGLRRRRRGKGFSYTRDDGSPVKANGALARVKALAIPPAWTDVWISSDPNGHLQATGRDARGRKQYRYHDRWRAIRDANKFDRVGDFGLALGTIRPAVQAHLRASQPTRETVLATVVHLLDETLIRVGNAEYADDNDTYGLTTLQADHVEAGQRKVIFRFIGKHNLEHEITVRDAKLATIVRRCHELGGKELFTYADEDGVPVSITSADVNEHLRELAGGDGLSAKDFRTWGGTVTAVEVLADLGPATSAKELDSNVLTAIDEAADRLHNTRTVCRNCYVHPGVVDAYRDEQLADAFKASRQTQWYSRPERATLTILGAA